MRAAFAESLAELASTDERIVLLTGDLGFMALEPFSLTHPERFFNAGVAEQNMIGVATGMAEAGFIPFAYSIVTFATLRPYEFIRNGPILHQLPVRIIGVGGGLEYGNAGPTHYGLEDVAVMRTQPGISVIAPADHEQARSAILATWDLAGPIYYRIGKDNSTVVPGLNGRFELGRAQTVRSGTDVALIAMGSVSAEVARAADILAERGISASVTIVASVSPAPVSDLLEVISAAQHVVTVEAHYTTGGLGSLVAEIMADNAVSRKLLRCGVDDTPDGISGSERFMLERYGLTCERIADRTIDLMEHSSASRTVEDGPQVAQV